MGIGPEEKGWGRRRVELTHRHVGARSNKGVGHGIYELAAHTKVAQLDLTARVDQDVGGLDIYVAEGTNKQMYIKFSASSYCISSVVNTLLLII